MTNHDDDINPDVAPHRDGHVRSSPHGCIHVRNVHRRRITRGDAGDERYLGDRPGDCDASFDDVSASDRRRQRWPSGQRDALRDADVHIIRDGDAYDYDHITTHHHDNDDAYAYHHDDAHDNAHAYHHDDAHAYHHDQDLDHITALHNKHP